MDASLETLTSSSEKNTSLDHSKVFSRDSYYSSAESSSLNLVEVVNEPEKGFKCKICGKIFSIKYSTVRHINTVHFLERQFCCTFCKAGFKHKSHLNKHMLTSCRMKKSNT